LATKKMPTADKVAVAVRPLTEAERDNLLADTYLSDLIYDALLERGEASKVAELAQEINNPQIGYALVRTALDRDALEGTSRFVLMARLWNLKARYMDTTRSLERNLMDVIRAAGKPLSTAQLATELSVIYDRPAEVYFGLLSKVLGNENLYFKSTGSSYGLAEWLPLVDGEDLNEVALDNKLKPETLTPLRALSAKVGWSKATYAEASYKIVAALKGRPVSHRVLGVLAWAELGAGYDPRAHLAACLGESRLVWLSAERGKGRWITREQADKLERLLADRTSPLMEEAEEAPAPVVVAVPEPTPVAAPITEPEAVAEPVAVVTLEPEPEPEDTVKPLTVSEDDLQALSQVVSERGVSVELAELLALQYEVVPGDPSFKSDLAVLEATLKGDPRFLYVGAGRFREADTLPPFVYDLPEFLAFPDLQFVSMDGEIMDEEIEDEGFAGSLRQDIFLPLTQDAGDDEGHYTGAALESGESLTLVVKAHHKEIGTFPLCQIPEGFFPQDAPIVEVTLREEDGSSYDIIVNNERRLAFNFFSLYEKIVADSGGMFRLSATARPHEFRVEVLEETDPQIYLSPERYAELLSTREQAEESGDVATFDIVCELLEEYPKGLDFIQLLTEVNVVRRVARRKLASILSNYFCFVQKAGTGQWRFDTKKRDMGTDRTKRKYLKR
jgi:hypothetical protein